MTGKRPFPVMYKILPSFRPAVPLDASRVEGNTFHLTWEPTGDPSRYGADGRGRPPPPARRRNTAWRGDGPPSPGGRHPGRDTTRAGPDVRPAHPVRLPAAGPGHQPARVRATT